MYPTTRIMTAIFGVNNSGRGFEDDDLASGLHEKFLEVLESMKSTYKNGKPKFTDRHCRILLLRFGFENGHSHTLSEIGQELGISGARAGQIIHKTLRMLRYPTRSRILRTYILEGTKNEM